MEDKEARTGYARQSTTSKSVWFSFGLMGMVVVSAIVANVIIINYMMQRVSEVSLQVISVCIITFIESLISEV